MVKIMTSIITKNGDDFKKINGYTHFDCSFPARPASWLLDNGRLNLVLLGAELLASGLQAQVLLGHDDGSP